MRSFGQRMQGWAGPQPATLSGPAARRPPASCVAPGTVYYSTASDGAITPYRSDGRVWLQVGDASTPAPLLTGLVSYWNLADLVDAHGANTLSNGGATTFSGSGGKPGGYAVFSGAGGAYLIKTNPTTLALGDGKFTFAGWFYMTSVAGTVAIASLFDNGSGFPNDKCVWRLLYSQGSDRFYFGVPPSGDNSGEVSVLADGFGSVAAGAWYYIEVFHDPALNVIGIRVNNSTLDTAANAAGMSTRVPSFVLGAQNEGNAIPLIGRAASAGYWKSLRTPRERTFLYNAGAGRSYAEVAAYQG